MRALRFAAIGALLVGVSLLGWGTFRMRHAQIMPQAAPPSATQPANSQAQLPSVQARSGAAPKNDSANHLGPFSIAGHDYTVELQTRKVGLGSDEEANTVVAMEIRDSDGVAQYRRTFPYIEPKDAFVDSWSVSAVLLSGTNGTGVLISYDAYSEPSAPEEEPVSWWQLFGVVGGKFVSFGAPLEIQGGLITAGPPSPVYKTAGPAGPQADVVEFKVWTGHCRLAFPVRVDWAQGKLTPAQQCLKSGDGLSAGCQYKVIPEDSLSSSSGLTFVRLWPNPDEKSGPSAKTVVKKDSKVDLLTALVETKWSDGSNPTPNVSGDSQNAIAGAGSVGIVQNGDLWMKVRIDGKEGWMHSEEDFQALGLPEDE